MNILMKLIKLVVVDGCMPVSFNMIYHSGMNSTEHKFHHFKIN